MRFFSPNKPQLPPVNPKLFFFSGTAELNDRRIVQFLFEVGLYHLLANIAYGFQPQSTRISTAFSRRPGGRLTNGRLPLFHFRYQRRRRGFRSHSLPNELHRVKAGLQNVATQPTLPTLRRSLRDETYCAYPGEDPTQHSVDLAEKNADLPVSLLCKGN